MKRSGAQWCMSDNHGWAPDRICFKNKSLSASLLSQSPLLILHTFVIFLQKA